MELLNYQYLRFFQVVTILYTKRKRVEKDGGIRTMIIGDDFDGL